MFFSWTEMIIAIPSHNMPLHRNYVQLNNGFSSFVHGTAYAIVAIVNPQSYGAVCLLRGNGKINTSVITKMVLKIGSK